MLYVTDDIGVRVLGKAHGDTPPRPEFLIVELSIAGQPKILFSVIYRPPKAGYFTDFEYVFSGLSPVYSNIVIIGDFNIDMLTSNFESGTLRGFVESNGLHMIPFSSTHNLLNSNTWIDHCIVDDSSKVLDACQLPVPFLSQHDALVVTLLSRVPQAMPQKITYRDFRNFDHDVFIQHLGCADWNSFYNFNDVNDMAEFLTNSLTSSLDTVAPMRSVFPRNACRPAPWLTDEIKALMR